MKIDWKMCFEFHGSKSRVEDIFIVEQSWFSRRRRGRKGGGCGAEKKS